MINQSFQIPEGYVLVMGDHEKPVQQEKDWAQNLVDKRQIAGKVEAVVFPFDRVQRIG